ncbi:hypothetical protein CHS0354_017136, partial [Potamilus streckersoni]
MYNDPLDIYGEKLNGIDCTDKELPASYLNYRDVTDKEMTLYQYFELTGQISWLIIYNTVR